MGGRVPPTERATGWSMAQVVRTEAVAWVDRRGQVRDRPHGEVLRHPELVRLFLAASRRQMDISFVWLGDPQHLVPRDQVTVIRIGPDGSGHSTFCLRRLPRRAVYGLTTRELEVLTALACGLSNPVIAERLALARRTVATHVERILEKTEVATRAAAAALAADQAVLGLPLRGGTMPPGLTRLGVVELQEAVDEVPPAVEHGHAAAAPSPRTAVRRPRALRIGALYPSTAEWASDGRLMRSGAELAVDEVNARGGVAGRPVALVPTWADVTSASSVAAAVERLVGEDVDAVTIGAAFDRSRDALAQQFGAAAAVGCPVLHHSTSVQAAGLVAEGPDYGNVFQVCPEADHYGSGFLRTLSMIYRSGDWRPDSNRLLVLDAVDPDLTTFPAAAVERAERLGWAVDVVGVDAHADSWRDAVDTVHRADPAAVLLGCYWAPHLVEFVRAFHRTPTHALLYAVYAPSIPRFLESSGSAAEGLVWATVTGLVPDRLGARFAQRYWQRFGSAPGHGSAGIHHDMVRLLSTGWALSGGGLDHRETLKALRGMVFRGVNGSYSFDNAAQTNQAYPDESLDSSLAQPQLVFQIQDGRHRVIGPEGFASARYRPRGD